MSVKKYEETLPVEELVEKAMKAMEMSYSPYSATLKMQRIHRPTVPSALHFLRRSARESESFVQSAL